MRICTSKLVCSILSGSLIKAALDYTAKDVELRITRERLARMETRIDGLATNVAQQIKAALSEVTEGFTTRIATEVKALSEVRDALANMEYILNKSGPPWNRTLTMKARIYR